MIPQALAQYLPQNVQQQLATPPTPPSFTPLYSFDIEEILQLLDSYQKMLE